MKIAFFSIVLISILLLVGGCVQQPAGTPPATTPPTTTPPGTTPPTPPVTATPPTPPSGSSTATVHITATGFNPSTVTVSSGTTITFVNDDSTAHWVASNPHPIHTDLSGFDARKALTTGESYSFTFTQAGSWAYHDHLNPSKTGTVTVQ